MLVPVLIWLGLAAVSTGVIWKAAEWLERSSQSLAAYYGLPAIVQGAIVAAIGSSFPELSSAVIATVLHGKFDLGVGAIVGSAIFNILVIPGLSGLYAGGIGSSRDVAYKEALFYIVSVLTLLITFNFAVMYNPVSETPLHGRVTPLLALLPIGVYCVYVFAQYQDTSEHDAETSEGINHLRQWGLLAISLVMIAVSVEGLVKAAVHLGDIFGTPDFLWGLTVIAAGTSLPDTLVSVRSADRGNGVASLANTFGSNTFDLLVAVPAGILVAGGTVVNFNTALPMMAFLAFATLLSFTVLRTDLELSPRESYVLLGSYVLFIGWLVAETFGVLNFVPTG